MQLLKSSIAIGASIGCVIVLSAAFHHSASSATHQDQQQYQERDRERERDHDAAGMDRFNLHIPDEIEWKEGPESLADGSMIAVLEGDPSEAGPFVFRLKLPDGFRIMPHTHPKVERVTVISGTFHLGMDATFDRDAARRLPAGTYGFWPAGMVHYAWAEGETVIQVHGEGPWSIEYVNPQDDPRYGNE